MPMKILSSEENIFSPLPHTYVRSYSCERLLGWCKANHYRLNKTGNNTKCKVSIDNRKISDSNRNRDGKSKGTF